LSEPDAYKRYVIIGYATPTTINSTAMTIMTPAVEENYLIEVASFYGYGGNSSSVPYIQVDIS